MVSPDPSYRTAETDYHVGEPPWPARYSSEIVVPAHARDMSQWRAPQDRHATPEIGALQRSRDGHRSHRRGQLHGLFLFSPSVDPTDLKVSAQSFQVFGSRDRRRQHLDDPRAWRRAFRHDLAPP